MDYNELIANLKKPLFAEGSYIVDHSRREAAQAITDLLAENQALRNAANGFKERAEKAEMERNEAVHDRMMMEQRTAELVDRAEADNKKLIAAMMQLKRTDRPERISVVYELQYDSSMSHKTMEDVAGILFRGIMDTDLKLRGQKEE